MNVSLCTRLSPHLIYPYPHSRDIFQDLDRLLRLPESASSASLPEASLTHAMAACACLISVLQLLANEDNFHHFTLARFDLGQVYV